MISGDLHFTVNHVWVRVEDNLWVVGLSDYAQEQLGELTFVELPEIDEHVAADDEIAVVESVKAANSIFAPADGTVVAPFQPPTTITGPPGNLAAAWLARTLLS